jgi:hypothetical protein
MKIVLTPDWFLGNDILIGFFSFVVLMIFSFFAFKNYNLKKNKSLFYLGIGFALIALAQMASILTKLVLYYDIGPSQVIGQVIITSHFLSSVDIFYYLGFFFNRFLTLTGLYIIYRVPERKMDFRDYFLVLYLIIVSSALSQEFHYIYYMTSFFFLVLIINNYYRKYKENKFTNTKILIFAFSILCLAQIIFLLSKVDILFVMANIAELISYVILLFLIIRIMKYGEKKKQNGNNIRYAVDNTRKKNWN